MKNYQLPDPDDDELNDDEGDNPPPVINPAHPGGDGN